LNAASTPLDGETWPAAPVVFGFWTPGAVFGEVSVSVDLVTVFGVGVGLGATTRVRVDCVFDEFVFWAKAQIVITSTTKAMNGNLFNMTWLLKVDLRVTEVQNRLR
jgi:hypothetical protein